MQHHKRATAYERDDKETCTAQPFYAHSYCFSILGVLRAAMKRPSAFGIGMIISSVKRRVRKGFTSAVFAGPPMFKRTMPVGDLRTEPQQQEIYLEKPEQAAARQAQPMLPNCQECGTQICGCRVNIERKEFREADKNQSMQMPIGDAIGHACWRRSVQTVH